jgi:hypothetical protein
VCVCVCVCVCVATGGHTCSDVGLDGLDPVGSLSRSASINVIAALAALVRRCDL